ncbi:ATP-binding protein [Bacillus clarus]|uniref:ATP-binding protein n=1 Tax=Bacillus clarus TaxID=2338372 RepID=UPI0035BBC977
MNHTDLCIILGNALDNAIEACKKVLDMNRRFIHIHIFRKKVYLIIKITNSRATERFVHEKKLFHTTKEDKINHGFGLQNINKTVQKYDGHLHIKTTDNTFYLSIIMKNS